MLQYKLPAGTAMADRVRMNTLALATTALAQSPSFWHAGTDLLRSKSLDRNSYNSGDWFNRVDWSAHESTWGSGLPPREDNESKWDFMTPLLARPGAEARAGRHARRARARRRAAADPLLVAAVPARQRGADPAARELPDRRAGPDAGRDRDGDRRPLRGRGRRLQRDADETTTQTVASLAGRRYRLHRVQAHGGDPVVRQSSYAAGSGAFTVPARTVAVFETKLRRRRGG